jgi:hypothetical protein
MPNLTQPNLTELLTRFLHKQPPDKWLESVGGDVTPYEVGPLQPIDAGQAWNEAVAVADYLVPGQTTSKWPIPPHWPALVSDQEPAIDLAFCFGNFPQLVRNFQLILHKRDKSGAKSGQGRALAVPALVEWASRVAAKKQVPHMLLALGGLRLSKNFDIAADYVRGQETHIPTEWRAAWDNEKAALAWCQGHARAAITLWESMEPSVPVLFNRGMAELFQDQPSRGRPFLNEAIAKLPETSAWHHLARLYVLLGSTE